MHCVTFTRAHRKQSRPMTHGNSQMLDGLRSACGRSGSGELVTSEISRRGLWLGFSFTKYTYWAEWTDCRTPVWWCSPYLFPSMEFVKVRLLSGDIDWTKESVMIEIKMSIYDLWGIHLYIYIKYTWGTCAKVQNGRGQRLWKSKDDNSWIFKRSN